MTLTIGQKLYDKDPYRSSYNEYTVEKIGRKWAQLDRGARCTVDTLHLDCGDYGTRKLYPSIEEHQVALRLDAAWRDLERDLRYAKRPNGLTVEKINDIRRELGLKVLGEGQNKEGK